MRRWRKMDTYWQDSPFPFPHSRCLLVSHEDMRLCRLIISYNTLRSGSASALGVSIFFVSCLSFPWVTDTILCALAEVSCNSGPKHFNLSCFVIVASHHFWKFLQLLNCYLSWSFLNIFQRRIPILDGFSASGMHLVWLRWIMFVILFPYCNFLFRNAWILCMNGSC